MRSDVLSVYIFCLIVMTTVIACGSGDDRLREKAAIESEASARLAIEAENDNRERRVAEMEDDLLERERFYESLSGTFRVSVSDSVEDKIAITIRPSFPLYRPMRKRTLEELVEDLTNYTLTVHSVAITNGRSFGCVFTDVRPDLKTGEIILSNVCATFPYLLLIHPTTNGRRVNRNEILDGNITSIDGIDVLASYKNSDTRKLMALARVSDEVVAQEGASAKTDKEIELELEYLNLQEWIAEKEAELDVLHRFYEAARGVYEASFDMDGRKKNIRLTLVPTVPRHRSDRRRALGEVESDLVNLSFKVPLLIWDDGRPTTTVGFSIPPTKADVRLGRLDLLATDSNNYYTVRLFDRPNATTESASALFATSESISEMLAAKIAEGKLDEIQYLAGRMQSGNRPETYHFIAERIEE